MPLLVSSIIVVAALVGLAVFVVARRTGRRSVRHLRGEAIVCGGERDFALDHEREARSMDLPFFRYHPDPIISGAFANRTEKCFCCGRTTPYVYAGPIYGYRYPNGILCPWCIVDGSAHDRFQVTFAVADPQIDANVAPEIVAVICERTPGFDTWQQDKWLVHCQDGCEFLGPATRATIRAMSGKEQEQLFGGEADDNWERSDFVRWYEPGGDPSIYHFRCLHCRENRFGMDCS
jgi:uncharacterized protein